MNKTIIYLFITLSVLVYCKKEHKVTIQAKDVITGDGSAYAGMSFVVVQSRPSWKEDKFKRVYEGIVLNIY